MDQITDTIWIGSSHSVDVHALRAVGIKAILNVAADLKGRLGWTDGFTYAQCGLWDGPGNPLSSYYSAVFELMRLQQLRLKTLVHCHAGVSRSPFVVLLYLLTRPDCSWPRTFLDTEEFLKSKRPKVNIHPVHRDRYLDMAKHLASLWEMGR